MAKKYLHHFNRAVVTGLEFLGLLVVLFFAGWLFLIIRLSQGPLNVDFLTHSIEKAMNGQQSGFEFNVGSTVMSWGGAAQPFEFDMSRVQISRSDKTPVLSVEKIGIQMSKRYLVFGRIVPQVIRIYGPALRVIRGEDGQFRLNISDTAAAPAAAENEDFMKGLLAHLHDKGTWGVLGGLEQVSITDAALFYEDKILDVGWRAKTANITFTRGRGGILVDSIANVEMDPTHNAYVRGSFYYSWQTDSPNGVIYFTGFNPALLAQQSATLKDFSGIDFPVKGSIVFEMDRDFKLGDGRFVLGADAGKFNAFGLYAAPIPVKSFYTKGRFNASTREMQMEQLRVDLDGPKFEAAGSVKKQADGHLVSLSADLLNMPMDRLKVYWLDKLTPDPRAWVTGHLSAGTATKATLDLALLAPQGDFNNLKLRKVGGKIDFNGIKVEYFPPLMPVTKVSGTASYDETSFNLNIGSGMLGDMQVLKSKISMTGMDVADDKTHSKIDIAVSLKGSLQTALKVLDGEPLRYPRRLGLEMADVKGEAAVDVNFKFPMYKQLTLDEVKATAKAKLEDVQLKNIVADLPLTGGSMNLSVDNGAMTVKGVGRLGAMPVEFNWLKNFSAGAAVASKVEAKLPLDAIALGKFGLPGDFAMAGTLPAQVTYTVAKDSTATLLFNGDLTPAAFTVPVASYTKRAGAPGSLDMVLHFKNGKPFQMTSLNLTTEGALLKGRVDFATDGKSLKKVSFDQFRLGGTDVALSVDNRGKDGYAVTVKGRQFDASRMLAGDEKPNSNSDAAADKPVTPLSVSMAVDRLVTGKDKYIEKIKMFMRRDGWNRIDQLEVDGVSGARPVLLRYLPVPHGHTLQFEADNAGAALSALGIANSVRGGKVLVNGQPDPQGGARGLVGAVSLMDFSLVNVPVLAKLLNAMSLSGIVELLNGKGISFKRMHAQFQWVDKGMPESAKNTRLLRIGNGETSGASLGLTFKGAIDNWANMLDISGTIIPVSDLNKLLSFIPLVGDILTGGGKGIFAATYTIKGPTDQPTTTVNPLAVLAPGILRKMFFEK